MNLEDFKSFRRVLKPSEVGSIPTHSRHFLPSSAPLLRLALPLLALLVLADPVAAWDGAGPSPFNRAMRSAAVPGWGQVTNGKPKKAVLQLGVQTYLLTRIVIETREAGEATREADRLRGLGDEGLAGEISLATDKADDHYRRRRDLIFWWILAAFYGGMDAYVDAHLGDFEKEIEEGKTLFSEIDPAARSVQLGIRF